MTTHKVEAIAEQDQARVALTEFRDTFDRARDDLHLRLYEICIELDAAPVQAEGSNDANATGANDNANPRSIGDNVSAQSLYQYH